MTSSQYRTEITSFLRPKIYYSNYFKTWGKDVNRVTAKRLLNTNKRFYSRKTSLIDCIQL